MYWADVAIRSPHNKTPGCKTASIILLYKYTDARQHQTKKAGRQIRQTAIMNAPFPVYEKLVKLSVLSTLSTWIYTSMQVTPSLSYSCSKQLSISSRGFSRKPLACRYAMIFL